jgi:uncharacterized repeat protein (TIGR03803 family)
MKKILLPAFLFCSLLSSAQSSIWGVTSSGGEFNAGVVFKTDASGNNFSLKHSLFRYDGDYPQSSLFQASDGKLYGMTSSCCTFDAFSVFFRFDPATLQYEKLYNFNDGIHGTTPNGSLIQAKDGKIYGLTSKGGTHNSGVIFELDPATKELKVRYNFDGASGNGPEATLMEAKDGKLYGMTATGGDKDYGVIFQFDPATSAYVKKFDFDGMVDGGNPQGNLIQAKNGKLYGLTSMGGKEDFGVLFEYDLATSTYTRKLDFDGTTTGGTPNGSLLEATDGYLYGYTSGGGANNFGVLFQYDPASSQYKVKFNFDDTNNGSAPQSALIQGKDGKLYGTTEYGGASGDGIMFQYDLSTSTFTKKFDFDDSGKSTGKYCIGAMVQATDGMLYGMGYNGGMDNSGVVYKYDPSTSTLTKQFDFHQAKTGSHPVGAIVPAKDKMLYGVTQFGGTKNNGTIYQFDPTTYSYTKKIDFDKAISGDAPTAPLLLASDRKFYGTTSYGGPNDDGILFQYDPATNILTPKVEFGGAKGSDPCGELVQLSNGKIYGTTREGGAKNEGVIFQFDPATGTYEKKIDFEGKVKGSYPEGGLTLAADGKLYGVTTGGGVNSSASIASGFGVLFQYDPSTNDFVKKIDFDGNGNGPNPNGTLVKTANGKLYGMTTTGGATSDTNHVGEGVLFEFDPATSLINNKLDFDMEKGRNPNGTLLLASDGNLYGVTNTGGKHDMGVIFQFNPATSNYTKKMEFTQLSGKFADHAKLTEITSPNSISENQLQANMQLFPNPSKELVTVSTQQKMNDANIRIVTVTGQTVLEKTKLSGDRFSLSIGELSSGAYFVELTENGKTARMKLVKE